MPVYTLSRFEIRPEARKEAEEAMHDFASYVRKELDLTTWTVYRDGDEPGRYIAMIRDETPAAGERRKKAEGTRAFEAALAGFTAGKVDAMRCELVTSSDLQRRHRGR